MAIQQHEAQGGHYDSLSLILADKPDERIEIEPDMPEGAYAGNVRIRVLGGLVEIVPLLSSSRYGEGAQLQNGGEPFAFDGAVYSARIPNNYDPVLVYVPTHKEEE